MGMMTETARVVSVDEQDYAWVETQRQTACGSCSVQKGCGTGVLARFFAGKSARVRVRNTLGAAVGDEVVIGMDDGLFVRTSLAVYLMPLIWMMLGAFAGTMLGERVDSINGEAASALFGALGLAIGFWWLRRYARATANDQRRQPNLLEIKKAPYSFPVSIEKKAS